MVSTHTNPACLPFVCEELFPADRAKGCGQKGAGMRGDHHGPCALGPSVLPRAQRAIRAPSHPLHTLSALSQSCLFPCPTKTSLDPRWVPALTLASVSSLEKGGSLAAFGGLCSLCLKDLAILGGLPPPQPPGHPAGPYAAGFGWVPEPRRGDQLVGAEGLERVAP